MNRRQIFFLPLLFSAGCVTTPSSEHAKKTDGFVFWQGGDFQYQEDKNRKVTAISVFPHSPGKETGKTEQIDDLVATENGFPYEGKANALAVSTSFYGHTDNKEKNFAHVDTNSFQIFKYNKQYFDHATIQFRVVCDKKNQYAEIPELKVIKRQEDGNICEGKLLLGHDKYKSLSRFNPVKNNRLMYESFLAGFAMNYFDPKQVKDAEKKNPAAILSPGDKNIPSSELGQLNFAVHACKPTAEDHEFYRKKMQYKGKDSLQLAAICWKTRMQGKSAKMKTQPYVAVFRVHMLNFDTINMAEFRPEDSYYQDHQVSMLPFTNSKDLVKPHQQGKLSQLNTCSFKEGPLAENTDSTHLNKTCRIDEGPGYAVLVSDHSLGQNTSSWIASGTVQDISHISAANVPEQYKKDVPTTKWTGKSAPRPSAHVTGWGLAWDKPRLTNKIGGHIEDVAEIIVKGPEGSTPSYVGYAQITSQLSRQGLVVSNPFSFKVFQCLNPFFCQVTTPKSGPEFKNTCKDAYRKTCISGT